MVPFDAELELAKQAARAAGAIQLSRRGAENVDLKADESPVTEVDRRCEALIREHLEKLD